MQPFTTLSAQNRRIHLERLKNEHALILAEEKRRDFAKRPACPYCQQKHVFKVGVNKFGRNRYKCSECKKSFTTQTGTCFHWLHLRSKFDKYMYSMMFDGHRSLKSMSLEFNISFVTAFDWRHKILASLQVTPKEFRGFVELRNTILPFSRKGIGKSKAANNPPEMPKLPVHLIITADSEHHKSICVASIGKLKASDIEAQLKNKFHFDCAIVSRISENKITNKQFSDAINGFGKSNNLSICRFDDEFNPYDHDDKYASQLNSDLSTLIFQKTRGVSTKYLEHYARWTAIMRTRKPIRDYMADAAIFNKGWAGYVAREEYFAQFAKSHSEIKHVQTSHRKWKTAKLLTGKT